MCDSKNELHKSEKGKRKENTAVRFVLPLNEATDHYPEFDFLDLFRKLEAKAKKDKKKKDEQTQPQLQQEKVAQDGISKSHLGSDDSDVEALARMYEEKYGTCNDYAELGEGYDEDDSFIDNTDAINDLLPNGLRTECGGFYINRGKLTFVKEENSSSSTSEDVDKFLAQNRVNARRIVSDDEDDKATENGRPSHVAPAVKSRKRSGEFHHKHKVAKKLRKTATPKIPEHLLQMKPFSTSSELKKSISEIKKNKLKNPEGEDALPPSINTVKKEFVNKKKAVTVKELLKERDGATEVIEAVATGADLLDKDSSSSSSSGSTSSTDSDTETSEDVKDVKDMKDVKEVKTVTAVETPPVLTAERPPADVTMPTLRPETNEVVARSLTQSDAGLKELMGKIMELSKEDRSRLSNSRLNHLLLSIDEKLKDVPSLEKNVVLEQLALILQMKRESITKRTKKIQFDQEEAKMAAPLRKLKEAIKDAMPLLESNYFKEFTKAAGTSPQIYAELSRYYWSIDPGALPQRRFPWTDELRALLRELVQLRKNCFYIMRPRKDTLSEYVRSFCDVKIKPLWPKDWMTVDILVEESRTDCAEDKQKMAKVLGNYTSQVSSQKKTSPSNIPQQQPQPPPPQVKALNQAVTITRKPPSEPSVLVPRKTPSHEQSVNHSYPMMPLAMPQNRLPLNFPSRFPNPNPGVVSRLPVSRPHHISPPKPHLSPNNLQVNNSSRRTNSPTQRNTSPGVRNTSPGVRTHSPTSSVRTNSPMHRNHVTTSAPKVQTIEIHSSPVPASRHPPASTETLLKDVPGSEILNLTKNSSISISKVVEESHSVPSPLNIPLPSGITISPTSSSSNFLNKPHRPREKSPEVKINVTLTKQQPALHNIPNCISVTSSSERDRHKYEPMRKRMLQEYQREQMSAESKLEENSSKPKERNELREVKTEPEANKEHLVQIEMNKVMQNLVKLSNHRDEDIEMDTTDLSRTQASAYQETFQNMVFK